MTTRPKDGRREEGVKYIDAKVETAVAGGARFLHEIMFKAVLPEHAVDRSLQRLRRLGRIRYLGRGDDPATSGWVWVVEVVEKGGRP